MKSVRVEDHADPVLVTTNSRVLDAVLAKQEKHPTLKRALSEMSDAINTAVEDSYCEPYPMTE